MLERILVPLDGSERAESVLQRIRTILRSEHTEVLLFQALDSSSWTQYAAARWETMEALRLNVDKDARTYLLKIEIRLKAEGIRARSMVRESTTADGIIETGLKEGATMIAMSTHGRSGVARFAFGSVTEKVLRASLLPLLLVRSFSFGSQNSALPESKTLEIRKILVPLDASDASMEVVPFATEIACRLPRSMTRAFPNSLSGNRCG